MIDAVSTQTKARISPNVRDGVTSNRRVVSGDDERITVYDFYRQETVDRSRLRIIEPILESLAHRFTGIFAANIRQAVRVVVGEFEQVQWEEYANSKPDPTFVSTAVAMPLDGRLLMHVPVPMLLQLLDFYLGGDGLSEPERDQLTDIEHILVAPIFDECWKALALAFSSAIELRIGLVQSSTSPILVQIGRPGETCLVTDMQLVVNEQPLNSFQLCIPLNALLPILEHLETQNSTAGLEPTSFETTQRLRIVPVELKACYPPITLTTTELLHLQPGDVISVYDGAATDNIEVDLVTGDVIIGTGVLIEQAGKLACSIKTKREDFS